MAPDNRRGEGVCVAGGSGTTHGGGAGGDAGSGDAVAGVDVGAVEFFRPSWESRERNAELTELIEIFNIPSQMGLLL